MSKTRIIRNTSLVGALVAGLMSATAFAQTTTAPANTTSAVPPGTVQIQPPKDPLVERREARKAANDQYKAEKAAAKSTYKQDVSAAKGEQKDAKKAANEAAKAELQQGTKQ
ncbi:MULTISPECIES: hypothetical protein [unclassified Cupriavidus]|uniref:hypothetical protein n=1 Tax=unclassified Cupriavidus TaxID=2640874 RepID=UPI0010F59612|nr:MULTISPECIES: hypothetical protein [unclassified Cupriavidus]MWL87398.1 hypothetical protein [Cupriavidus sp. SW-Y-13]